MIQVLEAGALLALGFILGRDGKRQLVVCPCGPDGMPVLPDLTGQVGAAQLALPQALRGMELLNDNLSLADNFQPRDTNTTYTLPKMVDVRQAINLVIVVSSTLDQAVTVQVVGHTSDSPDDRSGLMNIEAGQSLAAGSTAATKLGLGVDMEVNWYPYIGLTIATGASAPTAGRIQVFAAFRKLEAR